MSLRSFCAALGRWSWALIPPILTAFLTLALPQPAPWFDEAATVSATSRGWGQLWLLTQHQDVPLLGFYAIVKAVSDLTGVDSLTAGRGVSTTACILSSVVTAKCAHRLWGPRAGLIAGLAIALLPSTMSATVNARPEATSVFLVSVYLYAACSRQRVFQVVFGVLAALVYALNVLYLPLALLAPGLAGRRTNRGDLISTVTATALGLGWLLRCYEQAKQVSWISTNAPNDLLNCFIRVGFTAPLSHHHELPPLICSIALAVLCLLLVSATIGPFRATRKSATHGTILRLLTLWLAPPLVMTAAVLVGIDVFVERYFTPSTIGIALLVGFCSTRVRHRRVGQCMAAGCVALSVVPVISAHAPDGHWGEGPLAPPKGPRPFRSCSRELRSSS